MSNHTLYIQNHNEDKFEKEPEKGPLVNSLLSAYYSGNLQINNVAMSTTVPTAAVMASTSGSSNIPIPNTCPTGHLLDLTGKCLTKDCKYSK